MAAISSSISDVVNACTIDNLDGCESILIESAMEYIKIAVSLLLLLIAGYMGGFVISNIISRLLKTQNFVEFLVRYRAITTKGWNDVVNGFKQIVLWYIVLFVIVAGFPNYVLTNTLDFATSLIGFIVIVVCGYLIAGIARKIVNDLMLSIGFEETLEKLKVSTKIGELHIVDMVSGVIKWYLVLLFFIEGMLKFKEIVYLPIVMEKFVGYISSIILGGLVILIAGLIADFVANRIGSRKITVTDAIPLIAKGVIIFFGVVIALPHFGLEENVDIMKDSFKILMMGVSIGLAIAIGSIGWGLKDSFKTKIENKLK